jgi:3-oxoacyl-[acyl-carrier protein] reductase
LVTNAGGPVSGNFVDVEEEDFAAAIDLTLRSVERLIRAAIPHLRKSGARSEKGAPSISGGSNGGRIVNLTSITAKEPHDGLILSNTLRPAVHGLSKSLSRELGPWGITVNCVCPGFTNTERLRELSEAAARRRGVTAKEVMDGWRSNIPIGRLGEPSEIAAAVLFLCSAQSSFVNGASIVVDGGESRALG